MSKEQLKADFKAAVAASDDAALDAFYAGAQAEVVPQPLPDVQVQIDAAVLAKGQADQAALDQMKADLAAAVAADEADKAAVQAKQEVIDKIKALLG